MYNDLVAVETFVKMVYSTRERKNSLIIKELSRLLGGNEKACGKNL